MGIGVSGDEKGGGSTGQSDALLWLGAALVLGMGVVWLVLATPWSADEGRRPAVVRPAAEDEQGDSPARPEPNTELESESVGNPLRMAELAYEAGMLVDPEGYSAWALYSQALEQEPDNLAARQGLEKIAEELLRRAGAALEQGRFDDARATAERIRSVIPAHPGANELSMRIENLEPEPEPAVAESSEEPPAEPDDEDEAAEEPEIDPAVGPHEAFNEAIAQNRLLTPPGSSAKDFVDVLTSIDPEHELTRDARRRLFDELLARAADAITTMDTDAAETWIKEAEQLGESPAAVASLREQLRQQLIAAESARRVPASALTVVDYTPPVYPQRALQREVSGWVDVEFTVGRDGNPQDVTITDASHSDYFRDEAMRAVRQWRFEPRVFMGETIEQRAYTRINFELE